MPGPAYFEVVESFSHLCRLADVVAAGLLAHSRALRAVAALAVLYRAADLALRWVALGLARQRRGGLALSLALGYLAHGVACSFKMVKEYD